MPSDTALRIDLLEITNIKAEYKRLYRYYIETPTVQLPVGHNAHALTNLLLMDIYMNLLNSVCA